MDPGYFVHNQAHHQSQNPQQQHSGPSQLPDESYIERLFPKCQPKPSNHMRGNRKMARFNERQQQQQQQKRLSRNRNHPPAHARRERPQEQASNGTVASGSNTVDPGRNNDSNKAGAKFQKRYNYSDSSDNEEAQPNGKFGTATNGGVRRSGSNQFGYDATNKVDSGLGQLNNNDSAGQKLSTVYSKPRTKKYQASKSLQQQLSRSQSSHSRLTANSQPLPGAKSETNSEQRQLAASEPRGQVGEFPSSSADDVSGRKSDRGNRTRRGIVFAEPLPGRAGQFEIGSVLKRGDEGQHLVTPKCAAIEGSHTSADLLLSQSHQQIRPREQLAQVQPKQARIARRKTADIELIQNGPDQDAGQANTAAAAKTNSHPSPDIVNNHESIVEISRPTSIEPKDGVEPDQGDEDKFINLFVYDQTVLPNPKLDDECSESSSILQNHGEGKDINLNNSTDDKKPDERDRLLTNDFEDNEQGVITNDASTEELCSFDDNDTNISLKQRLTESKRMLEDEINPSGSLHQEKPNQDDSIYKSNLKHHRSIGTLQTVDEKAEINVEDDNPDTESYIIKSELIDISETGTMPQTRDEINVVRRSFVPPGFPQRVRPVFKAPTNPEAVSQPVVPCPELSPVDPATQPTNSKDEAAKTSSPSGEAWTLRDKAPSGEILGSSPTERADEFIIASESQSVVEKNISEALSKVTLDQMIADNFKSAPPSTNLRHHKLPNESSHFSAMRSPKFNTKESIALASHRSSVRFNTLSDNESGHDEICDSNQRSSKSSASMSSSRGKLKRQDTPATTGLSGSVRPLVSARVHEDLPTTTKTALVFPRLDEGLSSEAESNDEEAEEEDDRAMEADVDADDDEDEDEDDEDADEDTESPARNIGNRQGSLQTSVDTFFRHQQLLKPQNRSIGSLQQVNSSQQSQDSDLQPMKLSQSSTYANFSANDDQITRIDSTKPNHAGQNGVQSNYWMSGVTNQQATMSSQPSPSASQFTIQRNQFGNNNSNNNNNSNITNSNINLSRSNSYGNRDDAKAATRVSSDTDNETDRLLGTQRNDQLQKLTVNEVASSTQAVDSQSTNSFPSKQGTNSREVQIEGVLFNVKYLGSTHTECEGRGEKEDRIQQAEMAVHEVKFRNGELQTAVEAQLFISTEKIMVLDDKKRVIMMDHSLRTISYIADIGDAVVLIVRKKSSSLDAACDTGRPMSKTSCHVFESNESHTITKSISQAFHVAYTELLKANGGGDPNSYLPKELDYQEVLNSQEMPMTELDMFASKNNQREVIVPKQVGEILGLSIVESGWGSVLPTAVIASLKQDGPAYRCKKLSVGDQILSINGESLVGLSLAECQQKLRKTKAQSVARLWVVPCPITVEVKIKRPDTKYQLGFSVQHGVICSLLRGGIAERGGVRVGHRIISINGTTVVGVPHDKIVTLLASSVGEIRMKTCLTSLYRHMLGEEKKHQWV